MKLELNGANAYRVLKIIQDRYDTVISNGIARDMFGDVGSFN
jgi:hypothetical protein